ncbi:MAG: protein phosphatase 2C domain-containing protein [Oscillospiraceae bacterium]|nr:protein phosphatase 2C domain-containing protein [Oscillospiraceae bacterium]
MTNEFNLSSEEIHEQQLTMKIDEILPPANKVELTKEPVPSEQPKESAETPEKAPLPKLPQNPVVRKPAAPLSDMEVMEHTAGIWHYMDIIDNGTEMHTESHQKHTAAPFGEVIGARVRGKKHKHEGTNCDDYLETAVTEDFAVAVVCDGAGSKPLSRIGSRVSAETAVSFLKKSLSELFMQMPELKSGLSADLSSAEFMAACGRIAPLIRQSAQEAFKAQREELTRISADEKYQTALGRAPTLSDLSTTFLAAVVIPVTVNGVRETFMACVQVGDGCICALDSSADSAKCLRLMGEADSGAFSGETDFLSEKTVKPDVLGAKTRISRGSSDTILLMSDGVADDYFPANPMMERLYLDLQMNGIIPIEGKIPPSEDPAPIRFKCVSQSQQSVALQYTKQLLSSKSEDEMRALWDKRDALKCHSLEAFRINIGDTPEERLCVWLDNYNERGSFDDRTLVCIRIFRNS